MKTKILLFSLFICMSGIILGQNTIHIPTDYPTIQEGIDAAANGDEVLVDQGTYIENIDFKGKAITVTSNYINTLDSADIIHTIIDGGQPLDTNKASVVTFPYGSDTNSVICGFTIQKGKGTLFTNRAGGGIMCLYGGKIIHNRIINNSVFGDEDALGGGIWAEGTSSSYFVIKNNTIENNQLENTNSNYGCWGVAIGIYSGNIIVENNIIRSNSADGRPYGVGIYCNLCQGIVSHNIITNNEGYHSLSNRSRGGGMYLVNTYSTLIISNNEITHNELIQDGGTSETGGGISVLNTGGFEYNAVLIDKNTIRDNSAMHGGGISVTEVYNIEISNNVIRNNESEGYGAGIYLQDYNKGNEIANPINYSQNPEPLPEKNSLENPVIVNNTIINNNAIYGGGIASRMDKEEFIAFNNIVYENTATIQGPEVYIYTACHGNLYYNDLDTNDIGGTGTWTGTNNIVCDPEFIDDLCHLSCWTYSPCINAGIAELVIGTDTIKAPDHDFDGEERPQDDLYDIGAMEETICISINENPDQKDELTPVLYPNPITTEVTIEYILEEFSLVRIEVYDMLGYKKETLEHSIKYAGTHRMQWNAINYPSGVYFIRITTSDKTTTRKIIKR